MQRKIICVQMNDDWVCLINIKVFYKTAKCAMLLYGNLNNCKKYLPAYGKLWYSRGRLMWGQK